MESLRWKFMEYRESAYVSTDEAVLKLARALDVEIS